MRPGLTAAFSEQRANLSIPDNREIHPRDQIAVGGFVMQSVKLGSGFDKEQ